MSLCSINLGLTSEPTENYVSSIMNTLKDYLVAPKSLGYDHRDDKRQPAQLALRDAKQAISELVPPGYSVRYSGVAQNLPHIPWIAILDDDQTETTQEGIFLVYLYSSSLDKVYLSLNQGFTRHRNKVANLSKSERGGSIQAAALSSIGKETEAFKVHLKALEKSLQNVIYDIDLESDAELAEGYEAGHMLGFAYSTSNLPSNEQLLVDLDSLYGLYEEACNFADKSLLLNPDSWTTTSGKNEYKRTRALNIRETKYDDFVPRKSSEVRIRKPVVLPVTRSRKHEELITSFVEFIHPRGYLASNQNIGKRDLVLKSSRGEEFLVEAKTVSNDGESAVRDAIGQLLAYRFEYYSKDSWPELVALFNLPIADFWRLLLDDLGILWVYRKNGQWHSSPGMNI